jgi:SAM-dependent methyltransferase
MAAIYARRPAQKSQGPDPGVVQAAMRGSEIRVAGDIQVRSSGRTVGLFASMRRGRLLDVPCGAAEQSRALQRLGFEVVSIDLFPKQSGSGALRIVRADASRSFPLRSATFDYVLSREGIEHLENQAGFVRECARVLRPGGKLVVTTPNVSHLAARLSAFLTGQRNLKRGLVNEVQTLRGRNGSHLYHGHVFLIDYYRMRYILRIAGFERLQVFTDRYSPTSLALAPITPLIKASMRYAAWTAARHNLRKHRSAAPDEVTSEIIRHVTSPALLFGKRMIIVAEKSTGVESPSETADASGASGDLEGGRFSQAS